MAWAVGDLFGFGEEVIWVSIQGHLADHFERHQFFRNQLSGIEDVIGKTVSEGLIEDLQTASMVCCFRLMSFASGAKITASYSAQFYDLSRLSAYPSALAELGRFCIHPDHPDPDILRLAWGALTRIVDETGVELLFGCTSFEGSDPANYHDALALLKARHVAPDHLRPGQKSPDAFAFADHKPDLKRALIGMPPLLRTYLMMGGWVSDHAVIDNALDTLHVFTGLEIAAIPPARARVLRALASQGGAT